MSYWVTLGQNNKCAIQLVMPLSFSSCTLRSSRIAPDHINTLLEFMPVRWLTGITPFCHHPLLFSLWHMYQVSIYAIWRFLPSKDVRSKKKFPQCFTSWQLAPLVKFHSNNRLGNLNHFTLLGLKSIFPSTAGHSRVCLGLMLKIPIVVNGTIRLNSPLTPCWLVLICFMNSAVRQVS